MNPGPAVPARLVLSAGQPPPSADSLRNRQPPCLPFGPREISTSEKKSQSQPLAAGPTASAPFPGAAVKFLRGICVPARCPRPGPPPGPRAARPPLGLPPRAQAQTPSPPALLCAVSRPPPQTASRPHRPKTPRARFRPRNRQALPPERRRRKCLARGPPGRLRPSPGGQPASRRAPRGVSVGSEGQARCGSAGSSAPRLRGPAGRAQVSRVGRAELGPGPAAGPQSVRAALHPHPCAPPLKGARGGPGARRAARGETRAERSPRGARAGERGLRSG